MQFAVGQREIEERTVAIRRLGSKGQKTMPFEDALSMLQSEVENRR